MRWSDPQVRRACEVVEVGHALWGTLGRQTVGQCLALIDTAATLNALFGLAPLGIAISTVSTASTAAGLAMRYRSVEILADPHSPDGPLELSSEEHDVRVLEAADRLLIHDVRCCGRGANHGMAA